MAAKFLDNRPLTLCREWHPRRLLSADMFAPPLEAVRLARERLGIASLGVTVAKDPQLVKGSVAAKRHAVDACAASRRAAMSLDKPLHYAFSAGHARHDAGARQGSSPAPGSAQPCAHWPRPRPAGCHRLPQWPRSRRARTSPSAAPPAPPSAVCPGSRRAPHQGSLQWLEIRPYPAPVAGRGCATAPV